MFKPAAIFSDRMVLVRGREVRIFGEAENGAAISAVLKDGRGECIAKGSAVSRDGRFLLRLPPLEAAACGAWLHGAAGDICAGEIGQYGMLPSDMLDAMPRLLK